MYALVVLAVVTAMSAAAIGQFIAARRQIDAHRNRLQADWLARAGYEIAVAKLLMDPDAYTGETVKPIAGGEVKIVVKPDAAKKGVYHIESEAHYLAGERGAVVRIVRRTLEKVESPEGVRIEAANQES